MDALTADEITASAAILRAAGKLGETVRLVSLTLEENPKAEVRAWTTGKPFGRRAFAVLLDGDHLAEAHIDLDARTLTAWTPVENRQAAVTIDEFIAAAEIRKGDERWRAAMAKRGITEFDNVVCFPLTVGPSLDPALAGRRLLNVPCVDKSGAGNNFWGKPIENVMATVDVAAGKVLTVTDLGVVAAAAGNPKSRLGRFGPRPRRLQAGRNSRRRKVRTYPSPAARCAGTIGRSTFGSIRGWAQCCP